MSDAAQKTLQRIGILCMIFVACTVLFSVQAARKNTVHAASSAGPSLPVAYMQVEGLTVNPMTAYRQELRESTERETLTPLSVDRSLTFVIDPRQNSIGQVRYQVTSLETGKLLENGELNDMEDAGGMLAATFTLQTLEIRNEQEYMLRFSVALGDGSTVYFYTRLVQYGAGNVGAYLSFTNSFIDTATNKVTAADLGIYMEPDPAESNLSLAHITIKSSTDMLSWSSLAPTIVQRMPPTIQEINDMNIGICQQYIISATDEARNEEFYTVREYFRITEYMGQLIVRNYERDVAQIFDASLPVVSDSSVNLGIQPREVVYAENEKSTRVAFVANGDLWSFDAMNDRLVKIFSFRGQTKEDIPKPDLDTRTEFPRHGIAIGEINDEGDVSFVVYGYMPSGPHEGMMGVSVCRYTEKENQVEERIFLPLNQSLGLLERNVSRLSFVGGGNDLYLFLDTQLCKIDLDSGGFSVVETDIPESALMVSGLQRQVAWTDSENGEMGSVLTVRNLATGTRREIRANAGEKITLCGFVGEDLGYGLAREEEIFYRPDGSALQGMYTIRIEDENEVLKKEYLRENYYVTSANATPESLQLTLAMKGETALEAAGTDQIRNNEIREDRVIVAPEYTARTDETMHVRFASILLQSDPQVAEATYNSRKGSIETILEWPQTLQNAYYIYANGKLQDIEVDRRKAVQKAYAIYGGVLDASQRYIWQRGSWPISYRLDTDAMSSTLLEAGSSGDPQKFAEAIGKENEIVDLSGTELTGMFYAIARGRPVYAGLADGRSYLLVGYDETDVQIWNARKGETRTITRKSADKMFAQAGYVFYTYQKKEEPEESLEELQEGEPADAG